MKVLVVDDHAYNRELLSFILIDEGYECEFAENGLEAYNKCKEIEDLGVVLMDVNMPEMDGITATRKIKEEITDRLITIIFVTSLDDADVLENCLDAGGDDFVPKPLNESVLLAKINAHKRTRDLYKTVQESNKQLEFHKNMMDREHQIVERIFERGANRIKTDCVNVKCYSSPMSMFNGDVVLTAPCPSGGVYWMLGDFTGHGLAASIGSLPVTEIFYRLTAERAGVALIARALNRTLFDMLPDNMFCCAAIGRIEADGKTMALWMGGLNDIINVPADPSKPLDKIPAEHMPMGLLSPEEFDETPLLLEYQPGDRMYVFTDGINESTNGNGEQYGLDRIDEYLVKRNEDAFSGLINEVHDFSGSLEQSDDLSLVELTFGEVKHVDKETGEPVDVCQDAYAASSFPWTFSMKLQNEELRNTNIVDQLMDFVGGIHGINLHKEKIFTILSELFSNALEHGVLGLSSSLKESASGFEEYYRLREEGLKNIEGHYIDLSFSFHKGEQNRVVLEILDSGNGFDFETVIKKKDQESESEDAFGRGLSLLNTLCSSLEYSEGGRKVTAEYTFHS